MKLKVTYRRRTGAVSDVVITTEASATLEAVARELVEADPLGAGSFSGPMTLAVAPPGGQAVRLPADRAVGEAPIATGYEVEVVEAEVSGDRGVSAAAVVEVIAGPDRGRRFPIPTGSTVLGRDESADLVLADPYVSKRHARIDVGATIEMVDLNSANGLQSDGDVVSRITMLPGQEVRLGDTTVTVTGLSVAAPVATSDIVGGAMPFHRSPRVEGRFLEKELSRPAIPTEPTPPIFPWLSLIAPVLMGTSMYAITGNATSLLFVAMAPMMMGTNFLNSNKKNRRQVKTDLDKFNAQLFRLEEELSTSLPKEIAVRQAEVPAVAWVYQHALEGGPLLWTRRPEHWSFLHLRLGSATLPSRTTVAAPGELDEGIPEHTDQLADLVEKYRWCADVPVIESGALAGSLGIIGRQHAADALRGILVQLAGLHSPSEVVVTALASPAEAADMSWLRWLPHTSSPHSPLTGVHLADTQATVSQVIGGLENLAAERLGKRAQDRRQLSGPLESELVATGNAGRIGSADAVELPPMPLVVVVITENAPIDRARMIQLCERAAEIGILPIWVASEEQGLPAVCRTYVDVSQGLESAGTHFVRHGVVVEDVRVEGVSADNAMRFARALAPLYDAGAIVADATDLPGNVSMVSLLGEDLAVAGDAIVDRWRQNQAIHDRSGIAKPRARAGTLRALVGQMGVDAMHLDLRTQGPHALVGGTTGAGKSEFLQAWVLGMAAEYSPDRVTFLFVDYKGGAAFAECVRLPHCVGLVTDLSPHLVRRALTSLRAELHHREHLLNRKKAKDLLELEKRGDPDAPPALVLVIDEFAALVNEVPEFVDGVVDIAQRGRSLGIHLILATQRPAGVIRDNLRANTNLRIALRMADESDSTDVIGTPVAASFDPGIPGRGIVKSGPGRLTAFQSAYAGGHTSAEPPAAHVQIHELRFGAEVPWMKPEPEVDVIPADLGPTDQVRLVESMIAGARLAEVPTPRKPWLEELSHTYDLSLLGPRTDTELILGVSDVPEKQAQEVVHFRPDVDGNLAVYGTGGSGKSVLLRTLGIAAGVTPRGGPVHVYGLDFAAGGLRILEPLPHVGAIVPGDDDERVVRLLRTLREIAETRARLYPSANAGSVAEYRTLANKPDEPRILLLVDNFPSFRDTYEVAGPKGQCYAILQQLLSEGRSLGIHVVFTADRPGSVPGSIAASVPRRVVLRLADEAAYLMLGLPSDVLSASSPAGRAMVDGVETQIALFGGSGNVADQSQSIGKLARAMERQASVPAPRIAALPAEVSLADLPTQVDGWPVLGLSDETLGPIGFEPRGVFVLGGGPASGRTNALTAMAQAVQRWQDDTVMVYLGSRRSLLPSRVRFDIEATSPEDIAQSAKELVAAFGASERARHTAIFVESVSDLIGTAADSSVIELIRMVKRTDHLLVAEGDTASLASMHPLYTELKTARRGLLLQPDHMEGDQILRTTFPRASRSEFPVGRGMAGMRGRAVRVQVPLALGGDVPMVGSSDQP